MKKFIATIKNIYHIEELRNRILYTLGIILIYRVGSYIALPGVDVQALSQTSFTSSSGAVISNKSVFPDHPQSIIMYCNLFSAAKSM